MTITIEINNCDLERECVVMAEDEALPVDVIYSMAKDGLSMSLFMHLSDNPDDVANSLINQVKLYRNIFSFLNN